MRAFSAILLVSLCVYVSARSAIQKRSDDAQSTDTNKCTRTGGEHWNTMWKSEGEMKNQCDLQFIREDAEYFIKLLMEFGESEERLKTAKQNLDQGKPVSKEDEKLFEEHAKRVEKVAEVLKGAVELSKQDTQGKVIYPYPWQCGDPCSERNLKNLTEKATSKEKACSALEVEGICLFRAAYAIKSLAHGDECPEKAEYNLGVIRYIVKRVADEVNKIIKLAEICEPQEENVDTKKRILNRVEQLLLSLKSS